MGLKDFDIFIMVHSGSLWTDDQIQNVADLATSITGEKCHWGRDVEPNESATEEQRTVVGILISDKEKIRKGKFVRCCVNVSLSEIKANDDPTELLRVKLHNGVQMIENFLMEPVA